MSDSSPPDPPHFLGEAPNTPEVEGLFGDDLADMGYVMNHTRLWSHHPPAPKALFAMLGEMSSVAGLSIRQRGILVSACASALGDSYCSISWGGKLAAEADAGTAVAVLTGDHDALEEQDRVLAAWARKVASSPTDTTPDDVHELRQAGFDDRAILAITVYVALRLAFSTVNNPRRHPRSPPVGCGSRRRVGRHRIRSAAAGGLRANRVTNHGRCSPPRFARFAHRASADRHDR